REGSGLVKFAELYPDRYFDVGIAEQHALTFAAGLACEGVKPVVAIYSTFLQRAYDQLIHDVQIQKLPIVFAIDRAGLVGADGATHQGSFDLTYLRCLPNMTVMTPSDENECRQMLYTAFRMDTPVAVRYPRGTGPGVPPQSEMHELPLGKGEIRRRTTRAAGTQRVAILAFGSMLQPALTVAGEIDATVANMRYVKPLDEALVLELADSHTLLVTVEENVVQGGAGSAVLEALQHHRRAAPVLQLGLPDRFINHGDPGIQLAACGLNAEGLALSIRTRLAE
ncbi:MAG TPA: transketolase C-terminal domain-containing protein, partial [Burkholderiales bacterium]